MPAVQRVALGLFLIIIVPALPSRSCVLTSLRKSRKGLAFGFFFLIADTL
jgi:hypothetical protein